MSVTKKQFLEGAAAIAEVVSRIKPAVVSAYPITPQTHIVEDLAQRAVDKKATYEYVRAESEFAAASIVLGASATGARTYSATSSQGLLLMTEVLYNLSGLRLPVVMTVANRAISGPINIWNDHSDIMALRDCGAILLFAETHQEAIDQHILAYKVAENLNLPVLVNVDGFILTHAFTSCYLPDSQTIKKFLPQRKLITGEYLNPKNPVTIGVFSGPDTYPQFRGQLQKDLLAATETIKKDYTAWKKIFPTPKEKRALIDTGLIEYYGAKNPALVIVAMGTVCGTIKQVLDNYSGKVALLKIRCYRPFPSAAIKQALKGVKRVLVLEKSYGLGHESPLKLDLSAALWGEKIDLQAKVLGLGGQDITEKQIQSLIKKYEK